MMCFGQLEIYEVCVYMEKTNSWIRNTKLIISQQLLLIEEKEVTNRVRHERTKQSSMIHSDTVLFQVCFRIDRLAVLS